MAADVRAALESAPGTSHSPQGQMMVADTYRLLRIVLRVPDHFDVVMVPGSIRQLLSTVISAAAPVDGICVSAVSGYWGGFMADSCRAVVPRVVEAFGNYFAQTSPTEIGGPVRLVTMAEMETETGLMPDPAARNWVRKARASGALVIVDAACTAPIHPIDYDNVDVVTLGSHKCLGAPAGLAILLVRKDVTLRPNWALDAYRNDARHKLEFIDGIRQSPSHAPPLPTMPIELVSALEASLRAINAETSPLARAASAAAELREGCRSLDLNTPFVGVSGSPAGSTVTRIDIPPEIGSETVRQRLSELGYFVIGSIGASAGEGFIRVGTMSQPQCEPENVRSFLGALAESSRAR